MHVHPSSYLPPAASKLAEPWAAQSLALPCTRRTGITTLFAPRAHASRQSGEPLCCLSGLCLFRDADRTLAVRPPAFDRRTSRLCTKRWAQSRATRNPTLCSTPGRPSTRSAPTAPRRSVMGLAILVVALQFCSACFIHRPLQHWSNTGELLAWGAGAAAPGPEPRGRRPRCYGSH